MQSIFAGRALRNRGGAVIAAVGIAVLATILLVVYLHSYRSSVNSGKRPERVARCDGPDSAGDGRRPDREEGPLPGDDGPEGSAESAGASPIRSQMNGPIAAHDIFPGQQLTASDFTTQSETSIPYQLTGFQRAIAVPVDQAHGLVGQVANGNFVDVYVGARIPGGRCGGSTVHLLASNILVLVAPGSAGANCGPPRHERAGARIRLCGGQREDLARVAPAGRRDANAPDNG